MNNTKRELSHKVLISGLAVIFSLVMVLTMISAPTVQISSNASPQVAASTGSYIPNPMMNTNITWSSYNSSWGEMEYFNGTAQANLTAQPSNFYANPISIDTADIQSSQLETFANWTKNMGINPASGGQVKTLTNSSTSVTETVNTTAAQSTINELFLNIPIEKIPSTNLNFTYMTIAYQVSGAKITGEQAQLMLVNTTGTSTSPTNTTIYGSGTLYESLSLWQIIKNGSPKITMNYDTGTLITTGIYQNLPAANSTTYTLKITALDLTTYPIILGQNSTEAEVSQAIGNAHLTKFSPTDHMEIENGGYTVAVSQTLQSPTTQQNSINTNNYIEQATYQGTFTLPTAPDLSYSNSNITLAMTLPGSQYEVANLNGISYLSQIQAKSNGTFSFGTINPNSQNTIILEVEFTASQWNASSNPPSFWSIQGLEYYWWMGVIGLLSFIGLGSLASSHWGGTEENLKLPKGKFGR